VPRKLLDVPHRQQNSDGDCLAACAWMAFAHIGRSYPYADLLKRLGIRSYGAPASNILRLADSTYGVIYSQTDMNGLHAYLDRGLPVIVFVRTQELPYWSFGVDHALLVVGYDDASVFVNDPDLSEPNKRISTGDFELAWLERDYFYAVISTVR
jgi:ABC-type bacteriocin/lantibiotic exporter with double-glycine peptidase domain